ncbi:centrosomal protein of 192 kDa-like isoform X2 [Cynocephalus volans]|uniref:centrosomal protein of 192 kDa-like isoform X2 n=1 Tax=Cynocephalus volans TaxID=110931 RepID=UPI002FCC5463
MKSQHLSHALMKQLAFQSDVARTEEERAKTTGSFQCQDLFDRVLPLDQIQDSPVDFCLLSWMNNKEHKIVVPDTGKHFEDKTPNSDLSHASLLENEKLMSLTSLEDSSDDDIDDEMFYDDHLEAYFEQLAIPGMIYEDLGGQEPPEEDFKLLTSDPSQPSFGYFIRSPEKREPIALIRKSDVSRSNLEKGMAHFTHDQFSGDLNEQSPAQLNEGSITLQVEALESNSQVDENDVTLTADKGKTEDTFFMKNKLRRCKDKLPDSGDSVLSISTIASAIADASVSSDPSQLAAMIKALSNKTSDKAFQEDDKQKDCSNMSHFLPNDLEKSNGSSAFDMEKYL